MKKIIKFLILFFTVCTFTGVHAQTTTTVGNNWQFSPRAGYDIKQFYNNNTPYIDYKGGIDLGLSVDHYWKWFGVGADFDYIKNKPVNMYPNGIVYGTPPSFTLSEKDITRMFYGLGPDFRYQTASKKLSAELNTRVGLSNIKGGSLNYTEAMNGLLNYHAGYDVKNNLAAKGQLRLNYFINDFIGINVGAYYLYHLKVPESTNGGVASSYRTFFENAEGIKVLDKGSMVREKGCDCGISSIGVFGGLTFRLAKKVKPVETKTEPAACLACDKYSLAVTARDKFTKEILPNTDIALKDASGNIVQTGLTNSYGVVVFNDVKPDVYNIEGLLHEIALERNTTVKSEFLPNEVLQKEILYTDMNFILKGNAVICNSSTPISGVSVQLKDLKNASLKNSKTDESGEFVFHVKEQAEYSIRGIKEKYFSQTETISTSDFNRSTTLFVKLEICMEEADCGKSITLKNIHYDLDKYFIRNDAKPELNRLVEFMEDNPFVNLELSSHTDARATHAYNKTLSQNRANAAVDYIVSQGIKRTRLTGVGYGETSLLNGCADGVDCSEAQHQINRRTEMKVTCPN